MRTAQTGLIWRCSGAVLANSVLFPLKRVRKRSFSLVAICLMSLDGSHVKISKNADLHANGPNRAHLEPFRSGLGKFGALSCKIGREALFFICCDVFDVIGWFPHENIQECAFRANGSKRAHLELFRSRLSYFDALSCKTAREALFLTCCDLFDVVGWFPL